MKQLVYALAILSLSIVGCKSDSADKTPEIEAQLIDGTPFKLSELRGQYVVLDFWGSWCGPCLADAPKLVKLYEKYGDQVTFVSIAFEKDDRRWKKTSERFGFGWKHQIVEYTAVLIGSSIARDYGVTDIPAKFIVTPEGQLISGMDFNQMDAYLAAELGI
jgi:thiol-disulfide isomerase/thioredoxin